MFVLCISSSVYTKVFKIYKENISINNLEEKKKKSAKLIKDKERLKNFPRGSYREMITTHIVSSWILNQKRTLVGQLAEF